MAHLVDTDINLHHIPHRSADQLEIVRPVVLTLGCHEGDVDVPRVVVHRSAPAVPSSWNTTIQLQYNNQSGFHTGPP